MLWKVADQIRPKSINMVEDSSSNHDDKMLPILDMKVQVNNGYIEHRHYSKQKASSLLSLLHQLFLPQRC